MTIEKLQNSVFRSNHNYDLIPYEKLDEKNKRIFSKLSENSDFYGILVPKKDNTSLSIKAVCHNTARLYQTLVLPGKIPEDIELANGMEKIEALIFDNIIEIKSDKTDNFVSGINAYDNIDFEESTNKKGALYNISKDALLYGQELEINEKHILASRLYFYNRQPLTPSLSEVFLSSKKVMEYFFMDEYGHNYNLTRKNWRPIKIKGEFGKAWASFESLSEEPVSDNNVTYKLYLSTNVDSLKKDLTNILKILSSSKAFHLKIGKRITEMLRPDNFMIYFKNKDELMTTADNLKAVLSDTVPIGVPFTAEIFNDGLLSWGIDPPNNYKKSFLLRQESWRSWICGQLASSIIDAKKEKNSLESWRFATKKLRLMGIDTERWIPPESLWKGYE